MTAIRCEALTKRYATTTAVDSLDLTVATGQVFGFLGPNGSGKTTTMRMLLGLVRPTGGFAEVNGRTLPDPEHIYAIGAMIEEPAFYPWLSGRRNLDVLALSGPALPGGRDAIGRALERVGLAPVAQRKVKTYSQGMRQRLGLAAAVMREPPLLLLDEPTNGMDPAGILDFRELIREKADRGQTVFLSSHLLSEVAQVCDRVAIIAGGRVLTEGRVGELTAPSRRVEVTVRAAERANAAAALTRWPCTLAGDCRVLVDHTSSRDVNAVLVGAGIVPEQVSVREATLEEIFLGLTDGPRIGRPATTAGSTAAPTDQEGSHASSPG